MAILVPNATASIVLTMFQYSRFPHFLEMVTICLGVSGLRFFFTVVVVLRGCMSTSFLSGIRGGGTGMPAVERSRNDKRRTVPQLSVASACVSVAHLKWQTYGPAHWSASSGKEDVQCGNRYHRHTPRALVS